MRKRSITPKEVMEVYHAIPVKEPETKEEKRYYKAMTEKFLRVAMRFYEQTYTNAFKEL